MGYTDNLCMNCFEPLTAGCICRNCGFDNDSVTDTIFLPRRTALAKRYIAGNAISVENDSVVYIGYDTERNAVVTIREFLPRGICNRLEGNNDVHVRERYRKNFAGYKESFIKLWKTLKGLNSLSAVIPVLEVFEQNETAYAVCEKMDSVSLHDFLIRNTDNNILWDKARLMFMPILTTVEALHENGIVHGAINPDNLVLCRDGKVRLAGFCIGECNDASSELGFRPVAGYSALEQYDNSHRVCPATDIYAFSACIYRALVGTNPPEAPAREVNDKLMIPNSIANAVNAASAASDTENNAEMPPADKTADKKKQIKTIVAIAVAVVVLAAAVFCAVHFTKGGSDEPETSAPPVAAASKVTVPDFCRAGYTEADIKNQASWNSQFKITFKSEYSKEADEGIVFEQSVEAGTEVDQGTGIVLTVSKGIETIQVPDVGGKTKDDAVKTLEDAGLKVSVVTIYNDDNDTEGTVRKRNGMAPEAGETIAKGDEVIIQVYGEEVTEPETSEPTE